LAKTKEIFEQHGLEASQEDLEIVKFVCQLIGTRAARLSAAGVAALTMQINPTSKLVVAIDGSVFEHYPNFRARMQDALNEIFGANGPRVELQQARDGSGQGAGLIAALA
jgi:hexokinase